MDTNWRTSLWQQFGAAIDMLGNAVAVCPDALWRVRLWDDAELPESAAFWYIAYHTLFWLDLYLSGAVEGFVAPSESGKGGFGYDSLFVPEGSCRTFAEFTPEQKHSCSHRGRALVQAVVFLRSVS